MALPKQTDLPKVSRSLLVGRYLFPGIWLGVVAMVFIAALNTTEGLNLFVLMPVAMFVFGITMFRKAYAGIADHAYDNGDSLVLVYGRDLQRIAFNDVVNVNYQSTISPDRVTLTVRDSHANQSRTHDYAFIPKQRKLGFGELSLSHFPQRKNAYVDELIMRIDAARRSDQAGARAHLEAR